MPVRLNRIYTRRGDSGSTQLAGGRRVGKDSIVVESYGVLDELNSHVGLALALCREQGPVAATAETVLGPVRHHLFELGSLLAFDPEHDDFQAYCDSFAQPTPDGSDARIMKMEEDIDRLNAELESLPGFVLPGACIVSAQLHVARTVCRRLERVLIRRRQEVVVPDVVLAYVNRLSDLLFVMARWTTGELDCSEELWQPPKHPRKDN